MRCAKSLEMLTAAVLCTPLLLSCSRPVEDKTTLAITTLWILDRESRKETPAPDIFDTYIKLSEQYTAESPEGEVKEEALKAIAAFKRAREQWEVPEREQLFIAARTHFERADILTKHQVNP